MKVVAGVPSILGSLCAQCNEHFEDLKRLLTSIGIEFEVDPGLVRGLDYYTRAAFEVHHALLGAQSALGGGGRYDDLISIYGGPSTPAVGFAAGLDRILLAVEEERLAIQFDVSTDVYVVSVSEATRPTCFSLAASLRQSLRVEQDLTRRSLQAQMKSASNLGARFAVIVGEEEMTSGLLTVRDMGTGEQEKVPKDAVTGYLRRRLGKDSAAGS
jgi:histidyl-tRNA synthetase